MPVGTRWPVVGRQDELELFSAALEDPRRQAFCIYGPAGVGKTRLGDECLAIADAARRRTLRATADRSNGAVPLAALAHLLPAQALTGWPHDEEGSIETMRLLDATRRAMAPAVGDSGPPVLLIDDAGRLDQSSLIVLDHLIAQRATFVVATVNNGEPVPEIVTEWWREEWATRVDLRELDSVAVDTLLHVVLEGPLDRAASAELWHASEGNLLVLHELVAGAAATGTLARIDGVWRLQGPLGAPSRLGELVEDRLDMVAPEGRAVLELLALCQPVALSDLQSRFGLRDLEALEGDGLICTRADGRRLTVGFAHPLLGDLLRSRIPEAQARAIMLDQAATLERHGARRREDPVRVATWRLEACGEADPDLLLRAAHRARSDGVFTTAARLARASLAGRPTAVAALVLGDALHHLGLFEEAEAVLAEAMDRPDADDVVVEIVAMRRRNLLARRRGDEVASVGRHPASRPSTPTPRTELLVSEAETLISAGRPLDALALARRADVSTPPLAVLAAGPRAAALAMIGRTAEALTSSQRAHADLVQLGDALGLPPPGVHLTNELFALVQAGRLTEAGERGRAWLEDATRNGRPLDAMWLAIHLARLALAQGRPRTALRLADRAHGAVDAHHVDGLRPVVAAYRAVAHGLLGDAPASSEAADGIGRFDARFGYLFVEWPLGRAWSLAAIGDLQQARTQLIAAADEAERVGCFPSAGWLLHDAARLGALDAVSGRLAIVTGMTDSLLVKLWAEHASALVAGDAPRLAAASREFEAIGAVLAAAEAAAEAAEAWRRVGDERHAADANTRADRLAARCEGARTPVVVRARTFAALTGREREVAALAAQGLSSRAIGDQLSLSARTVDNHLGRVYAKLGVTSRGELTAKFEVAHRAGGR